MRRAIVGTLLLASALAGCSTGVDVSKDPVSLAYRDPSLPVDARVDSLLRQMTQDEKFGQMTQVEENALRTGDVARLGLGAALHGGGSITARGDVNDWATAITAHQREAVEDTRLGIPILYGVDAVHGFGSMYGATVFPQQIGLGAANDPALMTHVGRVTAAEASAAGVRWNFAPVLAVPGDVRWGRTYEAYSQDPAIVSALGAAYIQGLQGANLSDPTSVLATAKHYIGDGSTTYGSSTQFIMVPYLLDQGDTPADPTLLAGTLLPPYQAAIDAGAQSVMASFSSWGGQKVHGDAALLTTTLRGDLGFTGFVVSDWAGCNQVDPSDYHAAIAQCINAGVDMVMTPSDGDLLYEALVDDVTNGAITQERIDEAVRRILTVKFEMGLFEHPYADPAARAGVGSPANRAVARAAVAESQVLLANDGALPLRDAGITIAVVGNASNDMGIQAGGWTMSWQGSPGPVIPGTTIFEGIRDRVGSAGTVLDAFPAREPWTSASPWRARSHTPKASATPRRSRSPRCPSSTPLRGAAAPPSSSSSPAGP